MKHITLNTGNAVESPESTAEDIAMVKPLIAKGGIIPTREPFRVEVGVMVGAFSFSIHRGADPITFNVVAWTEEAAGQAWADLEKVYLDLSDQVPGLIAATAYPERPQSVPWLATLLLPSMLMQVPDELRWIGTFERVMAHAVLAEYAGRQ